MRIIKRKSLVEFSGKYPDSSVSLDNWYSVTKMARWLSFLDVQKTFASADQVKVGSGRTIVVFNIAYNRYRLIAAIHYKSKIVFVLTILTHKKYSQGKWKEQL